MVNRSKDESHIQFRINPELWLPGEEDRYTITGYNESGETINESERNAEEISFKRTLAGFELRIFEIK